MKTSNGSDVLISAYPAGLGCYGRIYDVVSPLKKLVLTSSFGFCLDYDVSNLGGADPFKEIIDSQYYFVLSGMMDEVVKSIDF